MKRPKEIVPVVERLFAQRGFKNTNSTKNIKCHLRFWHPEMLQLLTANLFEYLIKCNANK